MKARWRGRKTTGGSLASVWRRSKINGCFNLFFCLFVCLLLFTVLHLDCTPLHFSLTDAFFFTFFLKNSKKKRGGKNKEPFLRHDFPFFFLLIESQCSAPPLFFHRLLRTVKVVSARSAICVKTATLQRAGVQRLSSLLLPRMQHSKRNRKGEAA